MNDNNVGATSGRPQRKKNRLENFDYSSCGAYFITICTSERKNYFWENAGTIIDCPQNVELSIYGKIADKAIKNITCSYPSLSLESYVIMANHIHILLRVRADEHGRPLVAPTMSRVVKQLKGVVSKQIGVCIWQKSFHDHIIRNREDYEEHLRYIYENPMNWHYDELYKEN
ncbi:MAG: transposase [Clostridia bacterium]|nr:transposase [Clostridia bacterium]